MYPDQPIATADMASPYSRMSVQPMIQAHISPSAV